MKEMAEKPSSVFNLNSMEGWAGVLTFWPY